MDRVGTVVAGSGVGFGVGGRSVAPTAPKRPYRRPSVGGRFLSVSSPHGPDDCKLGVRMFGATGPGQGTQVNCPPPSPTVHYLFVLGLWSRLAGPLVVRQVRRVDGRDRLGLRFRLWVPGSPGLRSWGSPSCTVPESPIDRSNLGGPCRPSVLSFLQGKRSGCQRGRLLRSGRSGDVGSLVGGCDI